MRQWADRPARRKNWAISLARPMGPTSERRQSRSWEGIMSESQGPRRVILVAVDHSEPSRRALSFAADLIKADPTVEPHAVHAITPAYRTSHEEVRTRAVTQERDTRDDRAET